MQSKRLLIVEDQKSTLDFVVDFLKPNYAIAAAVTDGEALLAAAETNPADIALVDISLPGINGLEVAARLNKSHPGLKIVILTMHAKPEFVKAALAAGAAGFVLKNRMVLDLPPAIECALRGEQFISLPLAGAMGAA